MLGELVALLLEHETVDGAEVYRIAGKPVPQHRPEEVAIAPRAKTLALGATGAARPAAAGPATAVSTQKQAGAELAAGPE